MGARGVPVVFSTAAPRCSQPPRAPADPEQYAYLLGLYLGDGRLVTTAKFPVLRVFCANAYPGLITAQRHPRPLLRGLFHSDGCRCVNTVTRRGRIYRYPRYLFSNRSSDILRICGDALDLVGAAWRYNRAYSISVARAESVALLDSFIAKY